MPEALELSPLGPLDDPRVDDIHGGLKSHLARKRPLPALWSINSPNPSEGGVLQILTEPWRRRTCWGAPCFETFPFFFPELQLAIQPWPPAVIPEAV